MTTNNILYYNMIPVYENDLESIATAAILSCRVCDLVIDGMGGPGHAICIDCVNKLMSGKWKIVPME